MVRRLADESGVSGTGHILDGVLWHTGQVAVCWRTDIAGAQHGHTSIAIYPSFEAFYAIHVAAHPANRTGFDWPDGDRPAWLQALEAKATECDMIERLNEEQGEQVITLARQVGELRGELEALQAARVAAMAAAPYQAPPSDEAPPIVAEAMKADADAEDAADRFKDETRPVDLDAARALLPPPRGPLVCEDCRLKHGEEYPGEPSVVYRPQLDAVLCNDCAQNRGSPAPASRGPTCYVCGQPVNVVQAHVNEPTPDGQATRVRHVMGSPLCRAPS